MVLANKSLPMHRCRGFRKREVSMPGHDVSLRGREAQGKIRPRGCERIRPQGEVSHMRPDFVGQICAHASTDPKILFHALPRSS